MSVVAPSASAMERLGEWIASRPAGQVVVRGVDAVLRVVEKSLMWSTQTAHRPPACSHGNEAGAEDSDSIVVVVARPLAWPLFLPLLGVLGVVRVTFYCLTRVFLKPRDTTDMIHWLQGKRRRLRAVLSAGLKNMGHKHCGGRPDRTPNGTPCAKVKIASATTPDHERKRKYDDVEQSDWTDCSDDESTAVKLEKCAEDYHSDSDPDYVPNGDEDGDCSASSEDEDIEDEEGAVLVNGSLPDVPVPPTLGAFVPSIVTVEPPESVKPKQNLPAALEVV
ncbi:uncharacterized protein LOC117648157 isoform X2 [Thrips palmi]|uniref:Uncharacterized protein LOC117648157 isoform X2 n=1 Tax=Thrips palmi TaxID=161013 RepID=A0A6P8ZCF3_THRPL|nr:uncharacterized protein LOC117648157 isoform X2 [Thrips palmi]